MRIDEIQKGISENELGNVTSKSTNLWCRHPHQMNLMWLIEMIGRC